MSHSAIRRRITLAASSAALALLAATPAAHAAQASEVVSGGGLTFINSTPSDVAFPGATLTGGDLVRSQTQSIDVNDSSGSNAGWSVSATSTQFKAGTHALSLSATTILAPPADVCDAASTCTLATNGVSYPYVLPAGATAPTATKMFNAAANTGQGSQTVTPTWTLALPAATWAGGSGTPYTSTWTFTLVTGP